MRRVSEVSTSSNPDSLSLRYQKDFRSSNSLLRFVIGLRSFCFTSSFELGLRFGRFAPRLFLGRQANLALALFYDGKVDAAAREAKTALEEAREEVAAVLAGRRRAA